APGQITLLAGQWKIGKTALLAALLARLGAGGPLAGRHVRPGRAVVVSEEGASLWTGRCPRFAQIPSSNTQIPNNIQPSTGRHRELASALDFDGWRLELLWRLLIGVWILFQSGALAAFVDILIEMHWYAAPDEPDRRRRLLAWSRHDATPRQLL